MIQLEIDKRYRKPRLASLLTRALETALADQKAKLKSGITLKLTGDKQLKKLNERFLGETRTTDVLSFPAGADEARFQLVVVAVAAEPALPAHLARKAEAIETGRQSPSGVQ